MSEKQETKDFIKLMKSYREEVFMGRRFDERGENYSEPRFEDVSSYSSSKEYKKKRKNKKGKTVAKSIVGVLCALMLIFGSGMMYISLDLIPELNTRSISKDPNVIGIDPNTTTDSSIKNIALFGLDTRDDAFGGQSDAIMVLSIDNKHKKIKFTSILRDTKVEIDGYGINRINAAYAYGGAELAIKTLNQKFKLDIEDFVSINFVQLTNVVNAFGGTVVEITDEEAVQINKNLTMLQYEHEEASSSVRDSDYIEEVGGEKLLNGAQALAYARIRYIDTDTERTNRQKRVLVGLIERLKDMGVSDYTNLIKQITPMVETSLDFNEIIAMIPAISYDVESVNIPGDYERPWEGFDYNNGGAWMYIYDLDRAAKHIDTFIYEELSPYYDPAMGHGVDDWTQIMPSGYAKTYNFFDDEDYYYFAYDAGVAPDDWEPESEYRDRYEDDNDDGWNSGGDWNSGDGDWSSGDDDDDYDWNNGDNDNDGGDDGGGDHNGGDDGGGDYGSDGDDTITF